MNKVNHKFTVILALFTGVLVGVILTSIYYTVPSAVTTKSDGSDSKGSPIPIGTANPVVGEENQHEVLTHDNILIRVNEERLANGLEQLADDQFLSHYAELDLVNNCPITSHDNLRSRFNSGTFSAYKDVSEILESGSDTTSKVVDGFLSSPTHKDFLVGASWGWKSVGIGVSTGSTSCVSLIFGK